MVPFGYNTAWRVEVDRISPERWAELLDQFDDANFYQTYAYGRVRWGAKNLSHIVVKCGDDVLAMAQLRVLRPTPFKFGMAYLRWGPVCKRRGRPLDPSLARFVVRAIEEEYVGRRKLFLRVLPNIVSLERASTIQDAFRGFRPEPLSANSSYGTFILDLSPSLEDLRKNFDRKWRNQLTRSERNDLSVVAGEGAEEYRTFVRIYREMLKRKQFEPKMNLREFGRIQESLGLPNRMCILICQRKGEPIAGLVASAMGDSAIYLLGATGDAGLEWKGSYLLQWSLIRWLKERGVRWYDLGGVNREKNPGVYHFKKGLSGSYVSQENALTLSENAVSSAIVKAGLSLQATTLKFARLVNLA